MDIYSFFSEMGELETRYGRWVLAAAGVGIGSNEVTWDQYLEVTSHCVAPCADPEGR